MIGKLDPFPPYIFLFPLRHLISHQFSDGYAQKDGYYHDTRYEIFIHLAIFETVDNLLGSVVYHWSHEPMKKSFIGVVEHQVTCLWLFAGDYLDDKKHKQSDGCPHDGRRGQISVKAKIVSRCIAPVFGKRRHERKPAVIEVESDCRLGGCLVEDAANVEKLAEVESSGVMPCQKGRGDCQS